jgi:hydrogenase nickel incorporation protein HypA/HybF
MHERSLVTALLRRAREEADRNALGPVRSVRVDVGAFCGVEPALVTSAFEELAPRLLGPDAALELRVTALRARCCSCDLEFPVERFRFSCPECGGGADAIAGEEFRLVSITAERPAHPAGGVR